VTVTSYLHGFVGNILKIISTRFKPTWTVNIKELAQKLKPNHIKILNICWMKPNPKTSDVMNSRTTRDFLNIQQTPFQQLNVLSNNFYILSHFFDKAMNWNILVVSTAIKSENIVLYHNRISDWKSQAKIKTQQQYVSAHTAMISKLNLQLKLIS